MRIVRALAPPVLVVAVAVAVGTSAFAAGPAEQGQVKSALRSAHFAGLEGLRHPAPDALVDALDSPYYAEHFAPDVSAARLVKGSVTSQTQVWLIPGRDSVCLYLRQGVGGGASCQPNSEAAAGRLLLSWTEPGEGVSLVAGVIPDGVGSVELGGTSARTVEVDSNVYVATTDADLASFVDGQDRPQQITIPRPSK